MKAALTTAVLASLLLAGALSSAPIAPLALPEIVPGAVLTQPFGCTALALEPINLSCPTRHFHSGVDLAAPEGTPVHAAAAGVVHVVLGPGFGLHLVLTHDSRTQTLYGHLSAVLVKEGYNAGRGELIALVGSTGLSTGPHLHFEVRAEGTPVDPREWLT